MKGAKCGVSKKVHFQKKGPFYADPPFRWPSAVVGSACALGLVVVRACPWVIGARSLPERAFCLRAGWLRPRASGCIMIGGTMLPFLLSLLSPASEVKGALVFPAECLNDYKQCSPIPCNQQTNPEGRQLPCLSSTPDICTRLYVNTTLDPPRFVEQEACAAQLPAIPQHCLLFTNADVLNVQISSQFEAYPLQHLSQPQDYMEYASVLYDENSLLVVPGIGQWTGPPGISEYVMITNSYLNQGVFTMENVRLLEGSSMQGSDTTATDLNVTEIWAVNNYEPVVRRWHTKLRYHHCSVVNAVTQLTWGEGTHTSFRQQLEQNYTIPSICRTVQTHCLGEWQQFESQQACEVYLSGLPLFDPNCVKLWKGKSSYMGESQSCKWLHHFMIPISPWLHCFHVGPLGRPDVKGHKRCWVDECIPGAVSDVSPPNYTHVNGTRQPPAPPPPPSPYEKQLNIEMSILTALPFCFSTLFDGNCTSNCSQALNTVFGDSSDDELCDASHQPFQSVLLRSLSVSADVMFSLCPDRQANRQLNCKSLGNGAVTDVSLRKHRRGDPCPNPTEYLTRNGCARFNWYNTEREYWASFVSSRTFESDFSKNFGSLVQQEHMDIEYNFYLSLGMPLLDFEKEPAFMARFYSAVSSISEEPGRINISPQLQVRSSHADVVAALRHNQTRSNKWFGRSFAPTWNVLTKMDMLYTDGLLHRQFQALFPYLIPTLYKTSEEMIPSELLQTFSDELATNPQWLRAGRNNEDDLMKGMLRLIFKSLLGDRMDRISEADQQVLLTEMEAAAFLSVQATRPKKVHQKYGFLWSTAYLASIEQVVDKFKKIYPIEELRFTLQTQGLQELAREIEKLPLEFYRYLVREYIINSPVITLLTNQAKRMIQQEPCKMKRLWDLSPNNFVRELIRVYNTFQPTYVDPDDENRSILLDLPVANYDTSVFPHPDIFDPTRNLDNVITFNGLEGQITGAINSSDTLSRVCIGRQFVLESMISVIPLLFPVVLKCAPAPDFDVEVWGKDGLYLVPKKNPVPLEAPHIEIYRLMTTSGKKYNSRQRSDQDLLLVFETDVFEAPEFWMPTMQELLYEPGKISEIWVLNPTLVGPQLNQSGQMSAILSAAKSGEGWKHIVLASVSQLSWITAWQLEGQRDGKPAVLDGLFAFDSPHPFALQQLAMKPASGAIFPFKFPIAPIEVRAEQYKALRQLWEGEEGWSTAMEGSLLKVFTRWGPQRLLTYFDIYAYDESSDQYKVGWSELGMQYDYSVMDVGHVQVYMIYETQHNTRGNRLLYELSFPFTRASGTIEGLDYGAGALGVTQARWSHPDEVAGKLRHFCKQITTARLSLFADVVQDLNFDNINEAGQMAKILTIILSFISTYAGWCLETFVGGQMEPGVTNPTKVHNLWVFAQSVSGLLGFIAFFSDSIFGLKATKALPGLVTYSASLECSFTTLARFLHFTRSSFQHTVGSIKYWNKYVHDVLIVAVDIWFQFEFWAFYHSTVSNNWLTAGATMVYVAHLLYWCGGLCEYYALIMDKKYRKRENSQKSQDFHMHTVRYFYPEAAEAPLPPLLKSAPSPRPGLRAESFTTGDIPSVPPVHNSDLVLFS
eukprot:g71515.t1